MKIAIVTNMNGIGLQREYELLWHYLNTVGHVPCGIQYDAPIVENDAKFDLAIFLEVIPRNLLGLADRRWIFPNPEWTTPQMLEHIDRSFEKILTKTHEAQRIFEGLFPGRTHYTGFLCRNQCDLAISRLPIFLHLAGNSTIRGTDAVLDAWRWKKNGKHLEPGLIVIGTAKFCDTPEEFIVEAGAWNIQRITFHERVSEEQLKILQNMCMFHLLPSGTEGFGHALHEANSVGAKIITIGAPPMSELPFAYFLGAEKAGKYNLADIYRTSALEIFEAVDCVKNMKPSDLQSDVVREHFLNSNQYFREELEKHLGTPAKKVVRQRERKDGRKSIAFLGNFEAQESTENMILWALEERLGYNVDILQENRVGIAALRDAMDYNDAFLWVRTPGWLQVGDKEMFKFLVDMEERKAPTISVHLDKFWGIPAREKKIGLEPFWLTKHVWTADGSRDSDFKERGVNHHWMRPAVSEVYCHPGRPRDHLRCDVGFVGAKDYHEEYPFRRQLVEWLEKTYGDRFQHITNIRGHDLNDFYASCKVVVGDCIFAGTPKYWSDRLPETCGRDGFLLHPRVPGLENHPVAVYEPQDLDSLQKNIEYFLANEYSRSDIRRGAFNYTIRHDTWTHRMQQILGGVL
jgi:hypothetical protein